MSKNEQIAIGVVIVLVLAGLGYYWYQHEMKPAGTFVNTEAQLPSGSGTSDSDLQKDTAAIDTQIKGLSTDQATVDSAVNAQ